MNRRQAREEAFKILFEQYINTQELDIHAKTDDTYIINVVTGVLKEQERIDEKIKQHLKNWTFERIAPVEKAILRLSVYEILFVESIPIGYLLMRLWNLLMHTVMINQACLLMGFYRTCNKGVLMMSETIINGKVVAQNIRNEMKEAIASLKKKTIVTHLTVIIIGNHPSSASYVR